MHFRSAFTLGLLGLSSLAGAQTSTPGTYKLNNPSPPGKPCVLKAGTVLQGQGGALPKGLVPACESRIQQFAYLVPGTIAAEFYWGDLKTGQTIHQALVKNGFQYTETIKGEHGNVSMYNKANRTVMLTLQSYNDLGKVRPLVSLILIPKQ